MKPAPLLACLFSLASAHAADDLGERLFQDDFERVESQDQVDEPGKGWGTNSKSRAKGHKQVDLREGALFIYLHPEANHAVSVTHPAEFTDGSVRLRVRLDQPLDSLGLNFADLQCKEVHAGHLFAAHVSAKNVRLQDLKTGNMRLDIREARQAKQKLSEEQQAALKDKEKVFPSPVRLGQWHDLLVTVRGDELRVSIDGQEIGRHSSPGIGHPTKRLLRLSVPRNAVVDDVEIWRKK